MNNIKKSALSALLMILFILTIAGFIKKSSIDITKEGSQIITKNTVENLFKGTSDYYYKGEQDGKIWHVMNIYSTSNSRNKHEYNNSYYSFGKDTVTVLNKIILTGHNEKQTNLAFIP